jgi:hypothetical protein
MKHFLLLLTFVLMAFAGQAQSSPKTDLTVYPNPAIDYIQVSDHQDAVGQMVIFNLTGKRVKEFELVKGDRYFVADLPKGFYLVQLIDKNKRILTTQKLDKR